MPTPRNYRKEWLTYDSLPKRKKARAARGRARYALMKEGKVKVGDGKHVDHKNLRPTDNRRSNLRVTSARKNMSKQPATKPRIRRTRRV